MDQTTAQHRLNSELRRIEERDEQARRVRIFLREVEKEVGMAELSEALARTGYRKGLPAVSDLDLLTINMDAVLFHLCPLLGFNATPDKIINGAIAAEEDGEF